MIEVEGKIYNQHVVILINLGASHSYIDPKLLDRFYLENINIERSCLVQLAIGTKKMINEFVRSCPVDLNGVNTIVYLNAIQFGSYDILIGMDWLDDPGGDRWLPTYPTGSKYSFHVGNGFMFFWVPNF
jgi:hypothetical protein